MSDDEKFHIPDEVHEWLGLKKSEYLSKLIENQTPDDFGFEEFHLFDQKIQETVENPDKSFEETQDSYNIRTYFKTYSDARMIHHVVIGSIYEDKENKVEVFLPILTFVTRKEELLEVFSVGTVVTRPTLN